MLFRFESERKFFVEKRCVQSEVDLNVSGFGGGALFKLCSLRDKADQSGRLHPRSALCRRRPEIPGGFKNVSVIFVEKLHRHPGGLFGSDARRESLLQNRRLAPGNRMHGDKRHSRTRCGKRKLSQHADRARQNLRLFETGKPEAEVERIGHDVILTGIVADSMARALTQEKWPC